MTLQAVATPLVQSNACGSLTATHQWDGSLRRLCTREGVDVGLFPASGLESGPGNLVLRRREGGRAAAATALLGASAPGRLIRQGARQWVQGVWQGIQYRVELVLAAQDSAWFWHIELCNRSNQPLRLDLLLLQDVALSPWDAIRLNEAYVSHYIDHQPLQHPQHGTLVASRQNQPVAGRTPWLMSGSLQRCVAWASDARQLFSRGGDGLAAASDLLSDLPSTRWQHEHSLVGLQAEAFDVLPGQRVQHGFFGRLQADHPEPSSPADLAALQAVLALPEAQWQAPVEANDSDDAMSVGDRGPSLFARPTPFASRTAEQAELQACFPGPWRQEERDTHGALLSFFTGEATHVVTRAKEQIVMRPHGHVLRSGRHWTPDERALTSTLWMDGVFHSALTQGHASANRLLSNVRGHLGLQRAQGLRILVDAGQGWRLLHRPSAFAMTPQGAEWHYRDDTHHLCVRSDASTDEAAVGLQLQVLQGGPVRSLVLLHVALNGDDGLGGGPVNWQAVPGGLRIAPAAGTAMAQQFPGGHFKVLVQGTNTWAQVAGDEALFADGISRQQPCLCLRYDAVDQWALQLQGELLPQQGPVMLGTEVPGAQGPHWQLPAAGAGTAPACTLGALADWMPWLAHNALVHYLAPRGLEQYSGGGWGTRDVCQGPAELLSALGRPEALRDVLHRVFAAQNADGDWPQWFMFYPRDAHIRAGDSHGDVVYWPLLALADYLAATGDASLLAEPIGYHANGASFGAAVEPIADHVRRAWDVVQARRIAGTELAAYGHGDWNDALQPANPALREHLCSSWTVTLHVRTLRAWVAAWQRLGRPDEAAAAQARCDAVVADFQRLLMPGGVIAGYASFENPAQVAHLLHPTDERTGIRYSALPMVHAIIDELLTPEQAEAHLALMAQHLQGPDGMRLFDRPLRYDGGRMSLFQRGETATYFGREIGLMYMHLHLRWAEALAHLGRADAFLDALRLACPIALTAVVPQAAPRQANCYYSSSDAAFADRDQAFDHYSDVAGGQVKLEGGWRIYSSGAGIAYKLVVQRLLGLTQQGHQLIVDPVLPQALDGLQAQVPLYGRTVAVHYRVGPRGHGPLRVALNGRALPMTPCANRYRPGGVAVTLQALDAAWLDAAWLDGDNLIEIDVG